VFHVDGRASDRQTLNVQAAVRRGYWAWLLLPLSLVSVTCLVLDAFVRELIPESRSFWIVQPVLYVAHWQNLDSPASVEVSVGTIALLMAVVAVRIIRTRSPRASLVLELTAALMLGGALANLVEVATIGSVTDFVGIRGSGGIYSSGDLAFDVGAALLPLTAFKVAATMSRRRTALIAGAAAYLTVIVVGLTDPRSFGVVILATIIVVASGTVLLVRPLQSRLT